MLAPILPMENTNPMTRRQGVGAGIQYDVDLDSHRGDGGQAVDRAYQGGMRAGKRRGRQRRQ